MHDGRKARNVQLPSVAVKLNMLPMTEAHNSVECQDQWIMNWKGRGKETILV
jgi:hypothetical protein